MGLRYLTYCAFSPRFHITDTTHGNFNARLTVFTFAWNINLKCFWLELGAGEDIFLSVIRYYEDLGMISYFLGKIVQIF